MFKKTFSLLLATVLAFSCFAIGVSAVEAVPVTKVEAPLYVEYSIYAPVKTERVLIGSAYDYETSKFISLDYKEQETLYGATNVAMGIQLDWSIDGSEWNYTSEWDTNPAPTGFGNINSAPQSCFLYELFNLETELGREQAKDIIVENKADDGTVYYTYDLENHTIKFRLRNFLQYTKDYATVNLISDWTDVYEVKRNADIGEAPTELVPPEVISTSVQYAESGCPYIEFDIKTPEEIKKAETWFSVHNNNYIYLQVDTLIEGEDYWNTTEFSNTGMNYIDGKRDLYLNDSTLRSETKIYVRVHYLIYIDNTTMVSDWTEEKYFELPAWAADGNTIKTPREICSFCGLCTPVLGVCMFVWLAIILAVVVIIVVAVKVSKNNKALKAAPAGDDVAQDENAEDAAKELRRQQLERMKAETGMAKKEKKPDNQQNKKKK